MFAVLRHGEARFGAFQAAVDRVVGHPVNVVRGSELLGLPKIESITSVERDGLLLFALAVILGGVVLAGQALVRAVTAGAADLPTWRAMGADRGMAAGALGVAGRAHCRRRSRSPRSSSPLGPVVAVSDRARPPHRSRRRHARRLGGARPRRARARRSSCSGWRSRPRSGGSPAATPTRPHAQAGRRVDVPRRAPTRPADRLAARGRAGTRHAGGSRAVGARRRDRGRDRRGGLLHVPRRSRRHREHAVARGHRLGLRRRGRTRARSRTTSRPPSRTTATSAARCVRSGRGRSRSTACRRRRSAPRP